MGFLGVSVFLALDQTVGELCARDGGPVPAGSHVDSRRGEAAGFAFLATGDRPHFDIILPDLDERRWHGLMPSFAHRSQTPRAA